MIPPWLKRAIWLLVIYGILYVLISPLPELAAALSGKSALIVFVLVTYALVGLLWLISFAGFRPWHTHFFCQTDFLNKICVRLC